MSDEYMYSASTKGFYNMGTWTPETVPADAVGPISQEERNLLGEGESQGKVIVANELGWPILIDPPPPSGEQLLALQSVKLQQLTQLASAQKTALTNRIGVINDAIEFEEATPDELAELPVRQTQLTAWKRYAVLLGRVTTQPGWYVTVDWPVQPTEGMDLTVSAVSRPTAQTS